MFSRIVLTTVLLIATAVYPAASQDRAGSVGIAYLVSAEKGADATLKDVISGSAELQLARRTSSVENLGAGSLDPDTAAKPLVSAAKRNARFLLLISYTTNAQTIALAFHVFDVPEAKEISEAAQSGRIDLSLDGLVAQALDTALAGVEFPQAGQAAASGETDMSAVSEAGPGGEAGTPATAGTAAIASAPTAVAGADATTEAGATTGAGAAPIPPATAAGSGAASEPAAPSARRVAFVGISTGAAAFLPSGDAGSYFSVGGLATLSANLRFLLGPGTFGIGVLSGVGEMQATGAVTQAQILLVPIGVDARYTFNDGGFPGITLHVSAGPSLMNVTAAYAGSLTRVIPYLIGGMILELPLAPFLGLSIDAAWAAFFESSALTIMGFVPEVSLYVRF